MKNFHFTRRAVAVAISGCVALAVAGLPGMAQAQTQARKLMILASNQDIPNFDPHVASGYSSVWLLRNTYDALVRIEGNPAKIVPNLAESWVQSDSGLEYIFRIDPKAKFTDGTPVTADAVKYSIDRMVRINKGAAWMFAGIMDSKSVDVMTPSIIRITLTKPFGAFLQVMPWLFIVNPAKVEANKGADDGQTWLRTNIEGSGPFRVKRAEAGNLYELERVPTYWKTGGGNLSGAIWKIVRETTTQRLMLQRGEATMAMDLSSEDIHALQGKAGVVPIVEAEYRTFSIKMNTENGPLADVNLRKAISYAFDYKSMETAADYAQIMQGPLPTGILGHDPKLVVPRTDLARAKQYLAKSKYPSGGVKLTMTVVNGLEQQRLYALVLLDALKKLNITLDIKPTVWPDMVAMTKTPQTTPDFFPVYQTANYADADNIAFAAYHGSRNGNWQNPVYNNKKVDDLIMQARGERDQAKRVALYKTMQETIVEDAPDIFGVVEKRKMAMRSDLQNYKFTPIAGNAPELFPLSLK